jgi:ribosomal protein S14
MRKRSKKRYPQEIKSWKRVNIFNKENPQLIILNKRTTKWTSGHSRFWNTTLLKSQLKDIFSTFMIKVLKNNNNISHRALLFKSLPKKINHLTFKSKHKKPAKTNPITFLQREHLNWKLFNFDKRKATSKPTNFCLLLGKNSTYNRKLFFSRQSFRKLMRLNILTGIQKT